MNLAPDSFLDRLAWLDEPCERGIKPTREAFVAAQQTVLVGRHQHDDGGVGARKMLRLAVRTEATVTPVGERGRPAALGAKPMPLVPIDERLGLAPDRQLIAFEQRS